MLPHDPGDGDGRTPVPHADDVEGGGVTVGVLRKLLDSMNLPSVPKTSGKRGIHVFVPLAPGHTHEEAAEFSFTLASAVARSVPEGGEFHGGVEAARHRY